MHKLLGVFLFLFSGICAAAVPPDALIRDTSAEVIALIKQQKASGGDIKKLADTIDAKVLPHFNFTRMTKLAVGREWNNASAAQQQALIHEFHELLVRTYSKALEAYQNQNIEVMPGSVAADARETIVKSRVIQPGRQPVPIDYRMERASDEWKVFDVVVDGVSLVTNYRSSFADEITRGGIDGLIKMLVDKNKKNETDKPIGKK